MAKTKKSSSGEQRSISFPEIKDWHAVLVIVLLISLFFRDVLLQKAFFWEDFLYQFYPFRYFAAVSMAGGEMPLWNPYTFCGTPFQADIQSALFYVPNLLLTLFVSNGSLHFYWVELLIIIHYMIAGVCMYYLAKEFDLRRHVALFSGLIYALSGFMITHAIHQVVICQVAWLPLIVLLFRRMLIRRSILHMVLTGLVLGHAVLAGFPQLSLYIFFFLFLYFVFEFMISVKEHGFSTSIPLAPLAAGVIIVALGLTAIQLLPTIELAPQSQRAEITYQKSLEGMLSWEQLITVLVPKYFGASGAQSSTYWGPGVYWAYWETCFYIGIPALVCVIMSAFLIKRNRYAAFLFGTVVFALLYAVGDHFILHKFFFNFVPGFEKFRNAGRMSLLATFAGALLGGFGLQWLLGSVEAEAGKIQRVVTLFALGGIGVWFLAQRGLFQPSNTLRQYEQIHGIVTAEATTAVLLILVTTAVVLLFMRRKISGVILLTAIGILQFIDVSVFGFSQNNGDTNPREYYLQTGQTVAVLREQGAHEYFRVNSRQAGGMLLDRNQGMVDQIFLLEGYTPLALQRVYPPAKDWDHVCDLLNAKYRVVTDQQRRSMELTTASTYVPRAFIVYRENIIPDDKELKAYMESDAFNPSHTVVFEEDPHFATEQGGDSTTPAVSITSYKLNSITLNVSTAKSGFLVLSEIYYPGWKAYVDGSPRRVYRADWSLRAIPIEKGSHHIEFLFEPESYRHGSWITLGTIGFSVIGIVYLTRKRKNGERTTKMNS